jgi:hypothetical protein
MENNQTPTEGNMSNTDQLPAIGTTIEAQIDRADSFYKRVRGVVTAHRNGRVQIKATEVISKWDTEWSKHPTSCSMGVSLREIVG